MTGRHAWGRGTMAKPPEHAVRLAALAMVGNTFSAMLPLMLAVRAIVAASQPRDCPQVGDSAHDDTCTWCHGSGVVWVLRDEEDET